MGLIKNCRGMTLVELMVAVMVGAILVGAVYQFLVGQERTYQVEIQNIRMQQDARAGMDFLARELRMAGFGVEDDEDPATNVFVKLINNDSAPNNDIDNGTDAISFTVGEGHSSMVAAAADPGQDQVSVLAAGKACFEFQVGDEVDFLDVLLNGSKLLLNEAPYQIKAITYKDPAKADATVLTVTNKLTESLTVGDLVVIRRVTIQYRVRNHVLERRLSTNGGVTWSASQGLIDHVEDLQLSYAFDGSDADGLTDINPDAHAQAPNAIIWAVESGGTPGFLDSQIFCDGGTESIAPVSYQSDLSVAGDDTGDPSQVAIRAVKVSLLVHSEREFPDPRFRNRSQAPAIQDHRPASVPKDGFRRRVLEREVKFRNLGLNPDA